MIAANQKREAKLSCRNLWKIYGPHPERLDTGRLSGGSHLEICNDLRTSNHFAAVIDVTFDIFAGEIFVIMGLSGSGKSTLVRCLSRLIEPSAGLVLLDGEDLLQASEKRLIELRRRAMGMVFQNFGLLPHLTVRENVAFPLRIQGCPPAAQRDRAQEMIALVGLEGREGAYPHELSGGQQQRVGLARSLAVGPQLWFLDEPFSALDPLIRRQMQDEFLRLQRLLNKTIIFITHDIVEAFRLADRAAIMREGKVIQIGRPSEIVLNPADSYVAQFTKDVPLARVITVNDIMNQSASQACESQRTEQIAPDTTLEHLIPRLISGVSSFSVTADDGGQLGTVHASAVVDILARDRNRRESN